MKILFYLPDLRHGGAEQVMLSLLNNFHKDRVSVSLLLGEKKGDLLKSVNDEIPVYSLNSFHAQKAIFPLIKFCRKQKPDILFSCLGASVAVGLAAPFLPKKTKIITRLGNTMGAEISLINNPIKRFLIKSLNKIIYKRSDRFIFQSNYMKDDFLKVFNLSEQQKMFTINNPLEINKIIKLSRESTEERFDLIAVGRLKPQKDYFTLIEAIKILKNEGLNLTLGVIGIGELEAELNERIMRLELTGHIKLLGYQSNPYKYLKNSRIFISSSLYEGFSNVIIEALSLGVPVVATNCPGGNAEVIDDGENGYLCNVGDAQDLASKITLTYNKLTNFDNKKITEKTIERFNIDEIKKSYYSLFFE